MGNHAVQQLSNEKPIQAKRKASLGEKTTQVYNQDESFYSDKKPLKHVVRRCYSDFDDKKTHGAQLNKVQNEEDQVFDIQKLKKLRELQTKQQIQTKRQNIIRLTNNESQIYREINNPENSIHRVNQPLEKSKLIFILDWDDTLFFTSHVVRQRQPIKRVRVEDVVLKAFDSTVTQILNFCVNQGDVYIVTSSQEGWVNESSELFLPKTHQILFKSSKIRVFSSRQIIETDDDEIILKNKDRIFERIIEKMVLEEQAILMQSCNLELVCIGDSQEEIEAALTVYQHFKTKFRNFFVKTIKMKRNPNLTDLKQELDLILKKIETIAKTKKKMSIKLERTKSETDKLEKII